jgi:hypothetical protein
MKLIPITETEGINTIASFKTKKSLGYEGISNIILKHCVKATNKPFTYTCNFSLSYGTFPDRCKYALVIPVYKRGDIANRPNYRPISLLLSLSKVLEIMMFNRSNHLHSNRIIASEQFGFRNGITTENAIFSLINTMLTSLNNKQLIAGLFCDLSKAFDSVSHSILLQQFAYYGARGTCHNWFKYYLTNRQQKEIISNSGENSSSNWEIVTNGVPQGLVLGPLQFLISINDLPHKINYIAKPVIYADGTSILVNATDITELQTKINDSIHHTYEWFSVNRLTVNFDKTNTIKFRSKKGKEIHNCFSYHNSIIKESNNIKFLGLELDKFLNWKKHIDRLLPKLSTACFVIRTMSSYSNIPTLKMIYVPHFHSLLEYGIVFWDNSTGSVKVFKLQKRIIRLMTGSNARTSCRPLFPKLGIMTSSSQYIFSLMRFLSHNVELYTFNSTT